MTTRTQPKDTIIGMATGTVVRLLSATHNTAGILDNITAAGHDESMKFRERCALKADLKHNQLLMELQEQEALFVASASRNVVAEQ